MIYPSGNLKNKDKGIHQAIYNAGIPRRTLDFLHDMVYNDKSEKILSKWGLRKMEVRFNPMKITGVSAFGDVRGRTAAGVRSVYFVLCEGYSGELVRDITELDRMLSEDDRCVYRRITEFPVPDVKESAEYGDKWERFQSGESVFSPEKAEALKKTCEIYRSARKNLNPSIEKNLAKMRIKKKIICALKKVICGSIGVPVIV